MVSLSMKNCAVFLWSGMATWLDEWRSVSDSLASHYIGTHLHTGTWQWMQHEYCYCCLSFILYVGSDLFTFISKSYKRIQIQYVIYNKSSWFTGREMFIIFIAHVTELFFLCIYFPLKCVSSFHSTTSIQTWQETDRTEEKTQQRNKPMTPHINCMTVNITWLLPTWQEITGVKG
jgi:hypothetical protein